MNTLSRTAPPETSVIGPSLSRLLHRLETADHMDPDNAATLLREANINPMDLVPWYDFDHPVQDSYGRQLVMHRRNFELMVMSWAPGDYSAIHDHGIAEWGAVQYFGDADHIIFKEHNGALTTKERMTMTPRSVCAVDHSLIHLMGNPGHTSFISLHLYGRENPAEAITGNARIFDLWEQSIQRTDGGVFFCLPEHEIQWRETAPAADTETTLLHHNLMLNRMKNILESDRDNLSFIRLALQLQHAIDQLSNTTGRG